MAMLSYLPHKKSLEKILSAAVDSWLQLMGLLLMLLPRVITSGQRLSRLGTLCEVQIPGPDIFKMES